MAYHGVPKVLNGFSNLFDAWNYPVPRTNDRHVFNVIGVCVDFLECCKTRGTDYTMKFTLHDPSSIDRFGTSFQLFVKSPSMAPAIRNQGDVVICRNAEIFNSPKMGKYATLRKGLFTWAVIEHASLSNSSEDNSELTVHLSERDNKKAPYPTKEEIEYAKAILALEDGSRWQAPAPSTALQISATMAANGGTPKPSIGKHRVISEMDAPMNNRCYVDMTAEIRRFFETDLRLECSVTDYSENQHLYNHAYGTSTEDAAYDPGDPFGYADKSHKQLWPGPWGKRTMTVVLWEPHRTFALQNFAIGDFVSLRNVHIKMDSVGAKLEGVIHGDHINPEKILVSKLRAADAEFHDNLKELLRRKRTHEEFCKQSGLPFIRDANPEKLKKFIERPASSQPSIAGAALEPVQNESAKARKNRMRKEKQRAKAAAQAGGQPSGGPTGHPGNTGNINGTVPSLAPNAHIRTNVSAASLIRVDEILDPKLLERVTLGGNKWTAPFQNARYKSKVVVVGYWPRRLEEWVVSVRTNQYAALDGGEGSQEDEEVDTDGGEEGERMDVDGDEDRTSADGDGDGARWEWRFTLVVQDPTPATSTELQRGAERAQPQRPRQIELMVSGQDAEYLLREEACDLRRNRKALARLREKMFVLWGDLQERMEEQEQEEQATEAETKAKADDGRHVGPTGTVQGHVLAQARSQPFECYVAEYGVKKQGRDGQRIDDWERCWRMLHTTVA